MSGLAWNHACVVGVQAMDDQHGILMDTLNELRTQFAQGTDRRKMYEHLSRLVEFTGLHFDCEERLLERHGFPGLQQHRADHRQMLQSIRDAVARAEHGETDDMQRALGHLKRCFSAHVEGPDKHYGDWLNARGIY